MYSKKFRHAMNNVKKMKFKIVKKHIGDVGGIICFRF